MQKLGIDIKLQFSKQLLALIGIMSGGGLAILWFLKIFTIQINILISISTFFYAFLLLYKTRITTIKFNYQDWSLIKNANIIPINVLGSSTITGFVCILNFTQPGKLGKKSTVLFRDMMKAEEYRRLLVALRNGTHGNPQQNALP